MHMPRTPLRSIFIRIVRDELGKEEVDLRCTERHVTFSTEYILLFRLTTLCDHTSHFSGVNGYDSADASMIVFLAVRICAVWPFD